MRISPHGRYLYIYKVISLLCVLYAVVQLSLLRVIPAVHRPHKIACDAADPLKLHAFPGALRIANVVVFHIPSSSRPLYIVPLFQRKIKMDPSFYRPATERKIFSKTTETLPASTFSVVQNVSSGFVVISRYSFVFFGKLFSNGMIAPPQRMIPWPAGTLVMYESWFSEMFSSFASSSRSVAA